MDPTRPPGPTTVTDVVTGDVTGPRRPTREDQVWTPMTVSGVVPDHCSRRVGRPFTVKGPTPLLCTKNVYPTREHLLEET